MPQTEQMSASELTTLEQTNSATLEPLWRATLRDGFDSDDFAPEGGLYYRQNAEQQAGRLQFQTDVAFSGKGALKLSVIPTGTAGQTLSSERAEIWERTELRVPYDQGIWYGFAFKLAHPIPGDDHRYLIAQWKREIIPGARGDFSPFLALRLKNGKLHVTVETNFRPENEDCRSARSAMYRPNGVPVFLRPQKNQMRALVISDPNWIPSDGALYGSYTDKIVVTRHGNPLPSPETGWIDFVVFSKPGPEGNGRIEIYANSKPLVTVTGMIGHNDPGLGNNQYFKFGPYRSAHTHDWTVYYDDFRRSPHRAEVLG